MSPLGTLLPQFELRDVVSGTRRAYGPGSLTRPLVVMFLCCHCPYVIHIEKGISELARDYAGKAVDFVAICSNDETTYPQDAPDRMREQAIRLGWTFPYLHDATQEVARAFDAACTPDFFVYDASARLVYRGQFDSSRPGNNIPVTGSDLRAALDALISGERVSERQFPSLGCNIKWRN
ncbi:MAG: thioredoxin family protein [Methylacidiphilales bacterium]|nr:thioredoxin family protein [Candidatus Methylacidiphilales bacterium]MDW8349058.1 thioredoxin family protein [Verrucomicrobiae bacterium]